MSERNEKLAAIRERLERCVESATENAEAAFDRADVARHNGRAEAFMYVLRLPSLWPEREESA